MEGIKFIDEVQVFVRAGKGGEGSSAVKRTKRGFISWGGDGGKGGDVYFRANPNIFDLSKLLNKKSFLADPGERGLPNRKRGKDGQDLVIEVPIGTLIRDEEEKILFDLIRPEKLLIAKGGRGGRGNFKRKTTTPAQKGEARRITLDFRIPCDVAVLGPTNSGKSTLISQITNLKPKISEFPFTTKLPLWAGVKRDYKLFTILELPAIIGEKKEKLLGLKFLKHLTRAKVLIFLLEAGEFSYFEKIAQIKEVLSEGRVDFASKYILPLINKIDKINGGIPSGFMSISAKNKIGLEELIDKVFYYLNEEKKNSY